MADIAPPWPLRIAFAFGDERLAMHVCEAVGAEAELVYTAPVSEFDVARLAHDRVAAVLLNVDAGDAEDALQARLGDANVRVVFNDPETSVQLEGWARARWLRHLMAKLRGDANVDPPRPDALAARAGAGGLPSPLPVAAPSTAAALVEAPVDDTGASPPSRPGDAHGSPIESAAPAGSDAAVEPAAALGFADATTPVPSAAAPPLDAQDSSATLAAADVADESSSSAPDAPADDTVAGDPLDVDTEALSAMIDARLAEPDTTPPVDDLEATWAIPSPVLPLAATSEHAESDPPTASVGAPDDAVTDGPAEVVVSGDVADSDILANLPSLEEWALVDPDAELGITSHKPTATTLPEGLGSELQLLPLDGLAPAVDKDSLVKRWLEASDDRHHADGGKA